MTLVNACTMEALVQDGMAQTMNALRFVDVGNKHVLHTFEGADRDGTGYVSIHGASYGIGKRGKAEHILHSIDFLGVGTCNQSWHAQQ